MNVRGYELVQRSLDDRVTPDETAALLQALKDNAERRAQYLDYMNLDLARGAVADAAIVEKKTISEIPVEQPLGPDGCCLTQRQLTWQWY